MATNPRIPSDPHTVPEQKRPELVPPQPKRPNSAMPGVLLGIIVAVALLAAIVYYMPRAPKKSPPPTGAEVPIQPGSNELQFTELQLAMAPGGTGMNLQGQVMNTGNRPIIGIVAALAFRDASGKVLASVPAPVAGMAKKGANLQPDPFANDPLKPNAARPFRITVEQVPAGWNHQLPEMRVVTVSAAGGK
jgi:hypothetical protein